MKKTLIGFIIMVVAMFMALSGAVNAATKMSVEGAKNIEVGDEITLTVKFPEAFGYQFTVNYDDTKLEYLGTLEKPENGEFTSISVSINGEKYTSYDLKFKALEAGDTKITIKEPILTDENAELIDVEAPDPITFSITEPVIIPDPDENTTGNENNTTGDNTTGDENNIGNNNTTTDDENGNVAGNTDNGNTNKEDDGDKTITSLKDAKTGFDIMYVAYLLMAIVVAAVIVKVSKRK